LSETVDILEFDFSSAINGEKFKEFFGLNSPTNLKILKRSILNVLLVAIILWQIPCAAFSQKDRVPGKIIRDANDTLSGFILTDPASTNVNQVLFTEDEYGEHIVTFYPDQVDIVIIDMKEYKSLPVIYDDREVLNFIRRIVFGVYNLYEGYREDGKKIFFLQTAPDKILYLPEESKNEWLDQYFSDCEFKPSRFYYDEVSLTNLILKYSHCRQPENFVYQRERYKPEITVGVKVGSNISMMKFTDKLNPYRGISFEHKLGLQGGLLFEIDVNRFLQVEMDLFFSIIQGDLLDSVTFDLKRTDVNIPLLIRYTFNLDSRFDPFINLGLDFRILLNEKYRLIHSEGEMDLNPAKGVAGLMAGAGTCIPFGRKLRLIVDFRYSYYHYLAHPSPADKYALNHHVIGFSTGILF